MERNLEKEIDALKEELQEIKKLLSTSHKKDAAKDTAKQNKMVGHVQKMPDMYPDTNIMAILDELENTCGGQGESGAVSYLGVFASGGRQSTWVKHKVSTDELLPLIENGTAEKVLSCIGNSDRLSILLAILKKPRTVAELITECRFNSSGQVYHHMKPLLAADLIKEDSAAYPKGTYVIQPHKVQGIIMLLAGICDMVDETYSQSNWDNKNGNK